MITRRTFPEYNRKRRRKPALFLMGPPSSYKTFRLEAAIFLDGTVGEHQVSVLSRHSGQFTFG